jgi:hypothetical protein
MYSRYLKYKIRSIYISKIWTRSVDLSSSLISEWKQVRCNNFVFSLFKKRYNWKLFYKIRNRVSEKRLLNFELIRSGFFLTSKAVMKNVYSSH